MATPLIKLGDLVTTITGKAVPHFSKGDIPYLDIEALEKGIIKRFVAEKADVVENDIVIVKDGSRSGLVLHGKGGKLGSTLMALRIKEENIILTEYLYIYLLFLTEENGYYRRGSTIPHIDRERLLNSEIFIPDKSIQQMICTEVTPYINKVDTINGIIFRIEDLLQQVSFDGKNTIRGNVKRIQRLVDSALHKKLYDIFSKL